MHMISVDSTNIVSIGYEGDTLHVQFNSGKYAYYGVPQSVYDALMSASSKGSYLYENIRGRYGDTKIG